MKDCQIQVQTEATPAAETRRTLSPHVRLESQDGENAEASTVLRIELPGVPSENVELTVEGERMTVRGKCRSVDLDGFEKLRRSEFAHDVDFERAFRLSEKVDLEAIEADYENGVLEVRLPNRQPKKRQITIR